MKKITLIVSMLVLISMVSAQEPQGQKRGPKGDRAEMKIEKLQEHLELTDDQVADLKKLSEDMKPEFEEIRNDESLERPDKMRAHADLIEKRDAEVAKILTEEQLTKLEELKEKRKAKRKERKGMKREKRGDN